MIFEVYQTLQQWQANNTNAGMEGLPLYVNSIVPIFSSLLLFALFVIILFGTYFSSKRLTGIGDFSVSFVAAAFVTAIVAVIMSLIPGFVNIFVVIVCIALFIVSLVLLFLSKD